MPPEVAATRFTTDERAYFYARAILTVLMVLLFFDFLPHANVDQRLTYLVALSLLIVDGLAFWLAIRLTDVSAARAMSVVLIPDLVVIGLFTSLFHTFDDAFYPVCVLIAVVYALVEDRRTAIAAGVAIGLAYTVGHLYGERFTLIESTLFVLKAAAIVIIGVMVAASVEKQRLREVEAEADAEEKQRLSERMARRVAELQAVSEITEIVHSSLDFDTIAPTVLEILAAAIDIDSCCLFVVDKEKSETLFSASIGTISGLATSLAYGSTEENLDKHFSCVPVFDHTNTMVLFCAAADNIDDLSDEDRLVLSAVASELVVAVENSRLYKLTKRLAITDELTGLYNYRHFQQRLEEEVGRAKRYGKHVSLLMLDADDFKRFNDTQGHIAGDIALAEIGGILRGLVREVDVVARYGGEEFSIVLPETDAAGAYVVAEKVRESIAEHAFADAADIRGCALTISVGVATYPTHAEDKESLLREADDALYHAKHGGKNRVRTPVHTATIETPHTDNLTDRPADESTGD